MPILKKSISIIVLVVLILSLTITGYLYWRQFIYLDINAGETYYKIFDKNEILDGSEKSAQEVNQKLDQRLKKYHQTFEKMSSTTDENKLRALFYLNFVHMYGYYGNRQLSNQSFQDLLRGSEFFHCGTNTTFLAMLLDKAGYEFRTVSLGNGAHGFVEVKLNNNWQILDPTINTWIDKSTEELLAGSNRTNKQFFLKAADQYNTRAYENLIKVINTQDMMFKLGSGYKPKIDQYNYIDLKSYQY